MCRSIKTLRQPYTDDVTEADVHAAALQYVRKVSGFRAPAGHNAEPFDQAVETVAAATQALLDHLQARPAQRRRSRQRAVTGLQASPTRAATVRHPN